MDRRAFLGRLGLLAAPLTAEGQQAGKVPTLGFLGFTTASVAGPSTFDALRSALRERG